MLPPYAVKLLPHDPEWAEQAGREETRILEAVWPAIVEMHHVGSTSISGIAAKPIIDLVGVGPDLETIEAARPRIEALGYEWHGEYGLAGRRFCTLCDPASGLVNSTCTAMPPATTASTGTWRSAIIFAPGPPWRRRTSR